jgi:hypothetical protein
MKSIVHAVLAAALTAAGAVAGTAASAADMVVGVYAADPGVCGDARVLGRISQRFRHQVRNVPNLPDVEILDYYRIGESRFEPARDRWPVERRYCHAKAALSDGHSRTVWYLIENPMGFAGVGSNVEFCVSGFDRWHVYNGGCRVLR